MRKVMLLLSRLSLLALLALSPLVLSCVDEEEFPDTAQGNFEALWKIIDEHYCFFDYKQHEYGLDWNAVYNKYKVRAGEETGRYQLFEVLTDMLGELRDGHVNLYSSFDNGRYWSWHEDYPSNFSDTLQPTIALLLACAPASSTIISDICTMPVSPLPLVIAD